MHFEYVSMLNGKRWKTKTIKPTEVTITEVPTCAELVKNKILVAIQLTVADTFWNWCLKNTLAQYFAIGANQYQIYSESMYLSQQLLHQHFWDVSLTSNS